MYIFPREFGLHNVFTSAVDPWETAQPFKDYTMREEELRRVGLAAAPGSASGTTVGAARKKRSVPKRLRGSLLQLISKLQRRHARCSYRLLLDHYCPGKVSYPITFTMAEGNLDAC